MRAPKRPHAVFVLFLRSHRLNDSEHIGLLFLWIQTVVVLRVNLNVKLYVTFKASFKPSSVCLRETCAHIDPLLCNYI